MAPSAVVLLWGGYLPLYQDLIPFLLVVLPYDLEIIE